MIDHGERPALAQMSRCSPSSSSRTASRPASRKDAIRIADVIDRRDGVFAGHEPQQAPVVGFVHAGGEPPDHFVQVGHGLVGRGAVRPGPLGGIVEVGR